MSGHGPTLGRRAIPIYARLCRIGGFSVEDVDDDPAVVASAGGASDRADRARDPAAAADHAAEVVVGDGHLEDEVALFLELLDLDLIGLLDEGPDEELDQLAHRSAA